MKKYLFLIPFIFAGCQTVEPYSQKLDTMIGLTQAELIQKFGQPVETVTTGDKTELIYQKTRTNYTPAVSQVYTTPGATNNLGEYEYTTCDTVFTLQDNKIVDWKYRGTCYSY